MVKVVLPDLTPFLLSDEPPVHELLLAARLGYMTALSWLRLTTASFLIAGGSVILSTIAFLSTFLDYTCVTPAVYD